MPTSRKRERRKLKRHRRLRFRLVALVILKNLRYIESLQIDIRICFKGAPSMTTRHPIPRRTFLKGAGISLALPWLDAMRVGAKAPAPSPRRAVFCFFGLGINGRDFTPRDTGRNYTITPILRPLADLRNDFTIISGLKLTYSGGHVGDRTFLTGTNTRSAGAWLRVSCDQELAAAVGRQTRFPSLSLGIKRGTGFGGYYDHTLSWSPSGTPIPAENRPHLLLDHLSRPDTPETLRRREAEFSRRASVLDPLRAEARRLSGSL